MAIAPNYEPPPSFKDVLIRNSAGVWEMDWHWVKWFENLKAFLDSAGGTVNHNALSGKFGGDGTNFFHLSLTNFSTLTGGDTTDASGLHSHRSAGTVITTFGSLGTSPFTGTNNSAYEIVALVSGGTSVFVVISPGGTVGSTNAVYHLWPGQSIVISWATVPTLITIQR